MKIWYRANLLQVTVTLINANQEVSVFAWCTWPDTWHMVSKPLSCFHPLFTRGENIVFSHKNVFSSSRMIATTVRGQRASSFTDTLKPVDAQTSRRRKLRIFNNNSRKKQLRFSNTLNVYFSYRHALTPKQPLLSPRCPLPSRELWKP